MMANDSITNKNKGAEKVVNSIAEPPAEEEEEEVSAIEEEVIMDMKMSSTSATVPVESNDITNTPLYDTMIDEDVLSSPVARGRTTKEDTKDNDDSNIIHEMVLSPRSVLESGVVSPSSEPTTNFLKGLEMEEEEEHNDDQKQASINIQASSNNLNIENATDNATDSSSIDTANGVSTTDSSEGNENSSNSIYATPTSVKCNSPSSSHNHSNNNQYTQSNLLFQYVLNVSCWHLVSKRALVYKDEAKYIDEYGRTSLHLACMPAAQGYDTLGIMVGNGQMKPYTTAPPQLQVVKALINAYPLGIYKQNKWGCTPLHFASLYSHHTVLELLLQSELTLQVQQQPQHKQELSQRSCILYITNEDGHIPLYHMSMWYTFLLQRTLVRVRQEIKFLQTLKDKSLTEETKKEENIQVLLQQQGGTTATTSTTFTLYDRARQIIFEHDPEVRRVWHNIMVLVCSMYYGVVLPVSSNDNDNDNDKHNFSVDEYTKSLPKSNSDDDDDDDNNDEKQEEEIENELKSKSIKRSRPFLAPKKKKKGSLYESKVPAVEDDDLSIPGDLSSSSSSSFEYDISHCHGYKRYMVHACVGLDIYNKSHDKVGNKLMTAASAATTSSTTNNDFQSTIRTCCPSDVLDVALWLHRDELCIQEETYGNLPLHLAILKYSEAIIEKSNLQQQKQEHGKTKASHNNSDNDDDEVNTISSSTTENDYYENVINERRTILKKVLHAYPEATSVYNFQNKLPLHMSIELLGRYDPDIVALIYITYPSAASISIPSSSLAFVQQHITYTNTNSNSIQNMIKKKKHVSSTLVWPFMMMASSDICTNDECISNSGNGNKMETENEIKERFEEQQDNNEDMLVEIDNNNNIDDDDDSSSNDNTRSVRNNHINNNNEDDNNDNNDLVEPPNIVRLINHRTSIQEQEHTRNHNTTTKKKKNNNTCFACFDVAYMLLRACPEMERFYT